MPAQKGKGAPQFARTWNGPGKPPRQDKNKRFSFALADPPPAPSRTKPTFVSYTASTFVGTTTPKTVAPTVAVKDRIVVFVAVENEVGTVVVSGGSLTYTLMNSFIGTGWCAVQAYSATATATGTLTITGTATGVVNSWGMAAYVFRNSDGFGPGGINTEDTGVEPALAFATIGSNSAVANMILDWDAAATTGKTWRTVNSITPTVGNSLEKTATQEVAHMSVYSAYWDDTGPSATNTYGMTAPLQKPLQIAVEVLGSGGEFEGWGTSI